MTSLEESVKVLVRITENENEREEWMSLRSLIERFVSRAMLIDIEPVNMTATADADHTRTIVRMLRSWREEDAREGRNADELPDILNEGRPSGRKHFE